MLKERLLLESLRVTKRYFVQNRRPLDITDYGIQGQVALFAADTRPLVSPLLAILFNHCLSSASVQATLGQILDIIASYV